jgi:segregation and condensation protein B
MQVEQLKQVVEVLVFASDIPLSADQIKILVEETTTEDIGRAVEELNNDYRRTDRTFQIVHIGGGYQMVTHENYAAWVKKLFQGRLKQKLSQAALETLSVIAFRQPVAKPDIEAIRGVNCDGVIRTLLERKLVTIAGRAEGPGKPLLLKTTQEFLRHFGVNDISDLPKPKEIEELFKENGIQAQPNPLQEPGAQQEAFQDAEKAPAPDSMTDAEASGDPEAPGSIEDAAVPSKADAESAVSAAVETEPIRIETETHGPDDIEENPAAAEADVNHAAQ